MNDDEEDEWRMLMDDDGWWWMMMDDSYWWWMILNDSYWLANDRHQYVICIFINHAWSMLIVSTRILTFNGRDFDPTSFRSDSKRTPISVGISPVATAGWKNLTNKTHNKQKSWNFLWVRFVVRTDVHDLYVYIYIERERDVCFLIILLVVRFTRGQNDLIFERFFNCFFSRNPTAIQFTLTIETSFINQLEKRFRLSLTPWKKKQTQIPTTKKTSWWLNQPILKNTLKSNWIHLP